MQLLNLHSQMGPVTNSSSMLFLVRTNASSIQDLAKKFSLRIIDVSSGKKLWDDIYDAVIYSCLFVPDEDDGDYSMIYRHLKNQLPTLKDHPKYREMEECFQELEDIYRKHATDCKDYGEDRDPDCLECYRWVSNNSNEYYHPLDDGLLKDLVLVDVDSLEEEAIEELKEISGEYTWC